MMTCYEFKENWLSKHNESIYSDWARRWQKQNKLSKLKDYSSFVSKYGEAVEHILKIGLNTKQMQAICDCLINEHSTNTWANKVIEVEKWPVIAAVAIVKVLLGEKVDIVVRDFSELKHALGETHVKLFLTEIFGKFDIDVAFNDSEVMEELKHAYECQVVIGYMEHFKEHYIIQAAGGFKVRGNRPLDYVLIDDRVTCSIERLTDVTVCPYNVSGMSQLLEDIYTCIWLNIGGDPAYNAAESRKITENAVLREMFSYVSKDELRQVDTRMTDSDLAGVWAELIALKLIDANGKVLVADDRQNERTLQQLQGFDKWKPRIKRLVEIKLKEKKRLRVPQHFLPTVERYLKLWIKDAVQARILQEDLDYRYVEFAKGVRPVFEIADHETRTWTLDRSLVQFLELKSGANEQLARQYFDSIFITTKTYLALYKNTQQIFSGWQENESSASVMSREKCFRMVLDERETLEKMCKRQEINSEIKEVLWLSVLDQWTLWYAAVERSFEREEPQKMQLKLSNHLDSTRLSDERDSLSWVLPQRKLEIAKILSKEDDKYSRRKAVQLFDEVIKAASCLKLKSAAFYYKAFTLGKLGIVQNSRAVMESLRAAQNALIFHLRSLNEQLEKLEDVRRKEDHFFTSAKRNFNAQSVRADIKALSRYLASIRTILGNTVSAVGLCINGISERQALAIFVSLLENRFVTGFKLNEEMLDQEVTRKIAATYGLREDDFVEILNKFTQYTSERQFLRHLKDVTKCFKTRRLFWWTLLENKVLLNQRKVLIISEYWFSKLGLDIELRRSLSEDARLTLSDQGLNSLIVRDHSTELIDHIKEGKILLFDKLKVKFIVNDPRYYRLLKTHFVSSAIALGLDRAKLATIDFREVEPNLNIEALLGAGIPAQDSLFVWQELVRQSIVENNGAVKRNEVLFTCAECPAYEKPVRSLLDRAFVLETVRRLWLKAAEDDSLTSEKRHALFSSVRKLPAEIHRDLASDLIDGRVIEAPRVAQSLLIPRDSSKPKASKQLKKLSTIEGIVPERENRIKVISYLNQSRSLLADAKRVELTLQPVTNLPSRHGIFSFSEDTNVFDGVIVVQESANKLWCCHMLETHGSQEVFLRWNEIQSSPIHEWTAEYLISMALELAKDPETDLKTGVLRKEGRQCPLEYYKMLKILYDASV